ncbi:MAG: SDR family NAD(P)-dependent oxidoreductase [Actinophytocola sp.]|uniref:type I polyketide synthase n=1 Tax=Actinophytocola sp. TaxID=1872138 RepID=UPI0013291156|nr:type I polyketide synthase [Actinophytocola sp.]MPZ85701.1 SDR family NAD(P)-dependent oxidoreductase [Actinophytocola sp.]
MATDPAIAIIGMSGRFPGAPDPDALWDLVVEGRDAVTEAPADRPWLRDLYSPRPRTPGRVPSTRGGFLPDLDRFDAAFFDMSPREARKTDPQLRLLLETAYETAQDAGMPTEQLGRERTGVFVGNVYGDYWLRQLPDLDGLDFYAELGTGRGSLSGRLAYAFGLRGPALTVDTACSSSLTAIQLACQSLRARECDIALAGGANVILTPYATITFGQAGALSPNGRCAFGDASADGYVRSEAIGLVALKPLDRALADGDRVRAVILGGAVNNDGFTGSGMVAPTVEGQLEMLRAAYANAGVDPREVAFVEAHGTGTPLGDRVELTALSQVLGPRTPDQERCLVVSAKVCVGHTEAAAGVVGLIKAVLCLEHRLVPGNPQLVEPTPAIDWDTAPLRLPAGPTELPDAGHTVLAGVNSFGATGTNVHLVLGSAPRQQREDGPDGPGILAISARSAAALRTLAEEYVVLLESGPPPLRRLCAAAAQRRDHLDSRVVVTADSARGMADALRDFLAGRELTAGDQRRPRVVFVFPGQGSQWHGMGRTLLDAGPFREAMESCDAVIRTHGGWSLIDALHADDPAWLAQTAKVQPALWAMGVALARLWRAWGIEPDAVLGQSQGEIAAAYCAGALTLEQAGRLSCRRAALIDELAPRGAMCWVERPHADVPALLAELAATASVAVEESPVSTVLSGAPDEIDRIVDGCERRGISCQRVDVNYAAHSPQIDPVRQPLLDDLADLVPSPTTIPFLSTVTGDAVPGAALDRDYWWRNLRETVRLDQVVRAAAVLEQEPVIFLQLAPHPVLTTALQANGAHVLGSLRRDQPELSCLYESLAALYAAGCEPDWRQVHGGPGPFVDLPRHPWLRDSHWHQAANCPWPPIGRPATETPPRTETPTMTTAPHPLLGELANGHDSPEWRGGIDLARNGFLLDHRVAGQPVMPGAGFLELAQAAADRLFGGQPAQVSDMDFSELLLLADDLELRVRAEAETEGEGTDWRLRIASRPDPATEWTHHAEAVLRPADETAAPATLDEIRRRCPDWQAGERFYRTHASTGNSWRGAFRGIAELWRGDGEALARLRPAPDDGFSFHPGALDSCLQTIAAVLPERSDSDRGFVLLGVRRLRLHQPHVSGKLWVHTRLSAADPDEASADLTVLDHQGTPVAEITGVRARHLAAQPPARSEPWWHTWHWQEVTAEQAPAEPGNWLLLCGDTELDTELARHLTSAGCTVSTVHHGNGFATEGPGRFRAAPESEADLARVLAEASRDAPLSGVVSLWALATGTDGDASPREVQWTATDLCATLVPLANAVAQLPQSSGPRLFLLTRGAQTVARQGAGQAPWQAALWGFGQVLGLEEPDHTTTLVDLASSHVGGDEAADLGALLLSPGPENRIALRDGCRYAPRLLPGAATENSAGFALDAKDGIASLAPGPEQRRDPGPGEIEIRVSHAGLNYRDVLTATGALAGEDDTLLGRECAGTVTRLGADVDSLSVGDQVLAFAHPALRSHVVVDACLAVRKPERLTPAEAASLPLAYGSAYHALVTLAGLRPGERVLIHSATGGVGLAALQIARWRGATVYATAGTETKRDMLRTLGAVKVADSRDTRFADQFRDEGEYGGVDGGVDVVLNTLAGDAVEANFALLNPFGRYVDLAVNDVAHGRPLPMSVFSRCRSYLPVNFHDLYLRAPRRLGEILRTVTDLVDRGELTPPVHRIFLAEQAAEAFSLMARSAHVGKLTLAFGPVDRHRSIRRAARIRPDATYLVTGGLGGIGALLTQWLIDQGARHLLLTGRSHVTADAALAAPRATGAAVEYATVDVADQDAMADLLRRREREGLPAVAGVVHAAAVLDPAPVRDLSEVELDRTLRPKVAGGWALHRLFAETPLDFFVLFSSAVSLLGGLTLGHHLGAYAAGNAFTDALADFRRAAGLPATVVNWGYWAETGLADRLSKQHGHDVRPAGLLPIRPADAPDLFAAMLGAQGRLVCVPVDWPAYLAAYPQDADAPVLRDLLGGQHLRGPAPSTVVPAPRAPETTNGATDVAALDVSALEEWLVVQLAGVLGQPAEHVDRTRAMNRLGLDSLMAAELRNRLRREHGREVTVSQLLRAASLRALVTEIAS